MFATAVPTCPWMKLLRAFKRLSNRPYVIRLLGRIKQTAEDQRNAVEPKFQAAEEALFKAEDKFKANPGDAAAKADYEAKEKIYNELSSQIHIVNIEILTNIIRT